MFAERLKEILFAICATPSELARAMEIDPSNLSRMLTGKRVPQVGGKAAWRLATGLFSWADEHGKAPELCALIACEGADSAEVIEQQILQWLYEGIDVTTPKNPAPPQDPVPYRAFGERLSAAMDLAELSNIRLGRLINVDGSYISRFRHGLRSPKSNPKTMDTICSVLLERISEQGRVAQLAELMGVSQTLLVDEDEAFARFFGWLFETDNEGDGAAVEALLENFEAFSPDVKLALPSFEETDDRILRSGKSAYFGTDGLQEAVVRFLGTAIERGASELCLYSDQNMDWMVGDEAFRLKWAALMFECVRRGVRIRIIHSVDRDLREMIDAITSWLPLYLSGMVESYYCWKQRSARFSNTLFLCPGVACVEGSNVNRQEERCGVYRYHTDAAMLDAYGRSFSGLLGEAKQLVRVCRDLEGVGTALSGGEGMTVLGAALSLATMPESTLRSMLRRSGASEKARQAVLCAWESRKQLIASKLSSSFVHECMPVATNEQLLGGEVPADIPGLSLTYTPQEYAAHIRNIIELSDAHANYRFIGLPDVPFPSTQTIITEGVVTVSRMGAPQLTFTISHPALCGAFAEYANQIERHYKQDKLATRQQLAKYL